MQSYGDLWHNCISLIYVCSVFAVCHVGVLLSAAAILAGPRAREARDHALPGASGAASCGVQGLVQPLHEAVGARLAASDQDLEVKDAAISCTAACVALLGDALAAQVPPTLQVVPPSTALPLSLICNPPPVSHQWRQRTRTCLHELPSCRAWVEGVRGAVVVHPAGPGRNVPKN